jgi:hypothetical protein
VSHPCAPHCGLLIDIKKYVKAKEELRKLKYFIMQNNIIFRQSSKRNQNPSTYYNSETNLKFQHQPKYHPWDVFNVLGFITYLVDNQVKTQ